MKKDNSKSQSRLWDKESEEYLMNNLDLPLESLANFFDKSVGAIKVKIKRMLFKLNKPYLFEDEDIKKEIIQKYLCLCDELGMVAGQKDIYKKRKTDKDFPSCSKIIKYFGSARDFLKSAGIKTGFYDVDYNLDKWYDEFYKYSKKSGIYMFTNIYTKKTYIGKSKNIWDRIRNGYMTKLPIGKCHNILLQRAWDLYGADNFTLEILELCEENILNEREDYWITKKDSIKRDSGYNIDPVSNNKDCNNNRHFTEEMREKFRERMLGEKNWMYGKTHSERSKKLISMSHSRAVCQFDFSGIFIQRFYSMREAEKITGINASTIEDSCLNRINSVNYIWEYEDVINDSHVGVDEFIKNKIINLPKTNRIKVAQLNDVGDMVKIYPSVSGVKSQTGINVRYAIKSGRKCNGYFWRIVNE